jgi:hypothetical protein
LKVNVISPASSSNGYEHCNYSYDIIGYFFIRRAFQDLAGYPRVLGIIVMTFLRSASLQSLPEVGPARLLAAMLGDLGVSTLRSIKTMTVFLLFLEHQTSNAACFNARGTTL